MFFNRRKKRKPICLESIKKTDLWSPDKSDINSPEVCPTGSQRVSPVVPPERRNSIYIATRSHRGWSSCQGRMRLDYRTRLRRARQLNHGPRACAPRVADLWPVSLQKEIERKKERKGGHLVVVSKMTKTAAITMTDYDDNNIVAKLIDAIISGKYIIQTSLRSRFHTRALSSLYHRFT